MRFEQCRSTSFDEVPLQRLARPPGPSLKFNQDAGVECRLEDRPSSPRIFSTEPEERLPGHVLRLHSADPHLPQPSAPAAAALRRRRRPGPVPAFFTPDPSDSPLGSGGLLRLSRLTSPCRPPFLQVAGFPSPAPQRRGSPEGGTNELRLALSRSTRPPDTSNP